jgi:hypothetical protein
LLNKPQNDIDFELLDSPNPEHKLTLVANCLQPVTDQELHLLIVDTMNDDPAAVSGKLMKALQVKVVENHSSSPAFKTVHRYDPVLTRVTTGDASRDLEKRVFQIRENTNPRRNPTRGDAIQIVVVYYDGRLDETNGDVMLDLRRPTDNIPNAISLKAGITSKFTGTPGVRLLFLNAEGLATLERDRAGFVMSGDRQFDMLAALEVATARRGRIADVYSELKNRFAARRRQPPRDLFDSYVPLALVDLLIGNPGTPAPLR